ncbi:unnamed protein product [Protopolystoma xenopodis]|uniref:C2H2-type domain-containing protein n=1 Tax=Protopolystoma xenopodis TaxID=117903 RepID=A0A3S5B3I1_9PLAT|nr:unnamed protein product [Protopolystoma xenopodis]
MGLLPQVNAQDVLALHCPLCAFHSHWLNLLEAHFSRHHGARSAEFRLYQCSKCHKIASSKAFLSEHLVLHHRSGGKAKTTRWSRLDSLDARPGCRDNGHYEADSPPGDVVRRAESVNQPLADATETSGLERLASKSPDNEPGYIITFFRGHLCAHAPRPTESSTESRRDGPPGTTDIDATEANDRPVHLETTAACRHCSPGRRAHNRFAGLGLRHQCLFCPFTSAQPARLARHYVEHGIRRLQFFTAPSADATDRPKTNGGPASMKAPEADEAEEECPQASVAEAGKGETTDAGPDPDGDRAEDDEVDDNQVVKAAGGETKKPVSEGLLDDNGQMNYAKSSPDSADLKKRCEAMPSMLLPDHRGRRQVESRMKGRPITRGGEEIKKENEPATRPKKSKTTRKTSASGTGHPSQPDWCDQFSVGGCPRAIRGKF